MRCYALARGSAMECAAVLDGGRQLGVLDERLPADEIDSLVRTVTMLTKMCR